MTNANSYKQIVIGGGCAGLSICYHLLTQGETAPILLIERRSGYHEDRTWCFWDVEPTPFTHLATQTWQQWKVFDATKQAVQSTTQHPYCHLPSKVFYEHVLSQLRAYPNFTLHLDESVQRFTEEAERVTVCTTRDTYTGQYLIDARGLRETDPIVQLAKRTSRWIPQKFVGQRVVAHQPLFNPLTCTLMDFRVSQKNGLHFIYFLPTSPTEALVENVYMSHASISVDQHRAEIAAYLVERYHLQPDEWTVIQEEAGYIPMTDFRFPTRRGKRIFQLGMGGGQTRAASGYTFVRIQRSAQQLASALLEKDDALRENALRHSKIERARYRWLDTVFLRFMEMHLERCADLYQRMFARTSGDYMAQFMTERSSIWDDARLIAALPKRPFIRIALLTLLASAWEDLPVGLRARAHSSAKSQPEISISV